jgi:hypothetical protein
MFRFVLENATVLIGMAAAGAGYIVGKVVGAMQNQRMNDNVPKP